MKYFLGLTIFVLIMLGVVTIGSGIFVMKQFDLSSLFTQPDPDAVAAQEADDQLTPGIYAPLPTSEDAITEIEEAEIQEDGI